MSGGVQDKRSCLEDVSLSLGNANYTEPSDQEIAVNNDRLVEIGWLNIAQQLKDNCTKRGKKRKRRGTASNPSRSNEVHEDLEPINVDLNEPLNNGENSDIGLQAMPPKKKRGPLNAQNHWPRDEVIEEEIDKILFNDVGQPVGENITIMQDALSTCIFRTDVSLAYDDWCTIPLKKPDGTLAPKMKVWIAMQNKFKLPNYNRDALFRNMGARLRNFRCHLKKTYFDPCSTLEEALNQNVEGITAYDWKWLCNYWTKPEFTASSDKNKESRSALKDHHTSGRIPYACVAHDMVKLTGRPPARHEVYCVTHTKDGNPINDEARKNMEAFLQVIEDDPDFNAKLTYVEACGDDIYARAGVFKESAGRVSSMENGVSRTSLLGKSRVPTVEVENLKTQNVEIRKQNEALVEQVKALTQALERSNERMNTFEEWMRSQQSGASGKSSNSTIDTDGQNPSPVDLMAAYHYGEPAKKTASSIDAKQNDTNEGQNPSLVDEMPVYRHVDPAKNGAKSINTKQDEEEVHLLNKEGIVVARGTIFSKDPIYKEWRKVRIEKVFQDGKDMLLSFQTTDRQYCLGQVRAKKINWPKECIAYRRHDSSRSKKAPLSLSL